uniref:Peptidase S8/S53 domain-containing protein n=1 Tax=Amphimedon queenslandica TaxID=400682 RepID=A0A1X7T6T7_AMPQE
MEVFQEDKDIDLSPFSIDALEFEDNFRLVKDHMSQFTDEQYRNIVSCYRAEDNRFIRADSSDIHPSKGIIFELFKLFFPIWILLALIPEEEERTLTIEKIVVAEKIISRDTCISDQLRQRIGKGSLIIKKLTVVWLSNTLPSSIINLIKQLKDLGNVTCKYVKLKVVLNSISDNFLEKLRAVSEGSHELKLMRDYIRGSNGERITMNDDIMREISDQLEEDDLAAEVPLLKGIYDSPHQMFGDPTNALITGDNPIPTGDNPIPTNRILIAILGYGCSRSTSVNETESPLNNRIVDTKNFTNRTAPVYHDKRLTDDDANKSKFIICQTTYCNGTIANGATSKAIQWLREKWQETWKEDYDNLLVLIPYGGQYMEDETIQIHKATDEGIIIVCAAGELGGGVVFPAALGIVLSVGVADNGPKGREVDIHACTFGSCGPAAAVITYLLAILLSRINSLFKSEHPTDPLNRSMASAIKHASTFRYLHTCVIRELLVSEGNGSHNPQLGYGDGVKILNRLSTSICDGDLLQKLADVLPTDDASNSNQTITPNAINTEEIDAEKREELYHGLNGSRITVTVLDYDEPEERIEQMGQYNTSFKTFRAASIYKRHGEKCASVLHRISPEASIWCANNREDDYHLAFIDCKNHEPPIDVISYSLSEPSFCNDMCRVVNEAVMANKIIVFAAGNTGRKARNTVEYPGHIGNILVIGGCDEFHNHRIGFSAIGREVDFLAEGEIATNKGTYKGTSFAAPVVAGYIALLLQFIKENMNTDQDKIRAWSKNEEGTYEWRDIPAFDAAHNVYAMRTLLKLLVPKPQDHTETEGFGCLDFSKLFPCYCIENSHELVTGSAKRRIHETLQKFYKHM